LDFNEQRSGHFAPVRVNETLTLLFDEDTAFDSHHYAFHVTRVQRYLRAHQEGWISYGSAPWSLDDGKLNDWNGGRGVYFKDPNGHMLELTAMPQCVTPTLMRAEWSQRSAFRALHRLSCEAQAARQTG
jgi:hypothetical protein